MRIPAMEFSGPLREKIEYYRREREERAREKAEKKRLELEGRREAERQGEPALREWRTQQWVASLRLEPDENGWFSLMDHFVYGRFLQGECPDSLREILDGPEVEEPLGPCVYFLRIETGLVKIGRSTNPEKRLTDVRRALPFDSELLHLVKSMDHIALEKSYHERFADRRVRGEWFALTEEDLQTIRDETSPPTK
jgi:hypothetical protein